MNQISVTDLELLVLVHARLMLLNPVLQLVIHSECIVLFNAELRDVDGDTRVNLGFQLFQVCTGVVEVRFQSCLLDQSSKLSGGVG